ncbi:MAG: spore cortex biosynthesis protein YabQ [Oscillospiraceae bacterium]|nr:spore cortex biosynthesis protein YabQ [Oscillospiraceae bacterium]
MIYTTDIIGDQWKIFLEALAVGFVLGGCYDFLRFFRAAFSAKRKFFVASDFLYCLWAGFLTFSFLLNKNFGIPRFYIYFAEALGFFAWYFSIGRITLPVGRFFGRIFRAVFAPFVKIFRKIIKRAKNTCNNAKKIIFKTADKHKRLLKKKGGMVYNILCLNILKAFSFCGGKAGKERKSFEGNGTEKTKEGYVFEDSGHCVRNIHSLFPDFDPGEHKR